jgi:hypothetical protein
VKEVKLNLVTIKTQTDEYNVFSDENVKNEKLNGNMKFYYVKEGNDTIYGKVLLFDGVANDNKFNNGQSKVIELFTLEHSSDEFKLVEVSTGEVNPIKRILVPDGSVLRLSGSPILYKSSMFNLLNQLINMK